MNNPNKIWERFDKFVRGRLKHVPPDFKYIDLKKHELSRHKEITHMTLELLMKNECNQELRDLLRDWQVFWDM